MNLTADQCINLLWIHYMEENKLMFTPREVSELEIEVVSRFNHIDSPYKGKLKYPTQQLLAEFLSENSGTNPFKSEE